MLRENQIKEHLSLAYLHAVAAYESFACERISVDMDSIDATIKYGGKIDDSSEFESPQVDIQLKATSVKVDKKKSFKFDLSVKNYNDLRKQTLVPRYLVVLLLPSDQKTWLKLTKKQLALSKCAYWLSLNNFEGTENGDKIRIDIPTKNLFNGSILREWLIKASKGERD